LPDDLIIKLMVKRGYCEAHIDAAPTANELDTHLLLAAMGADVFVRPGARTKL
jgi:hypothetical protein